MSELQEQDGGTAFEDGPKIFNTSDLVGDFIVSTQISKTPTVIDGKAFWLRSMVAVLVEGKGTILASVPSFNIASGITLQRELTALLGRAKEVFEAPFKARVEELEKDNERLRQQYEDAVTRLEKLKQQSKQSKTTVSSRAKK